VNFEEGLSLAWQTVRANRLRTFLTTLGIVIGVMSVIGMMSIINALDRYMTNTLSAIGGNVFWIQKYPAVQMGRLDRKYLNRKDLKLEHAQAIRRSATEIAAVSAEIMIWGKQIRHKDLTTNPNVQVYGGDDYWLEVNGRYICEGRFFTAEEIRHKRAVIIMGQDVTDKLFPFASPLGQTIKIDNIRYEIIGVLESMGKMFGESQDNLVVLPYGTFTRQYGEWRSIGIAVKALPDRLAAAMSQVEGILRLARKVPPGAESDFEIVTSDSIMSTLRNLTGFVFIAAVIICAISLLVGGIGIMNIMLVAVTERTREIGIRKAIGAKKRHIRNQFLTESIGICLAGGVTGVLLGIVIGIAIGRALRLPPVIPIWSVVLGLSFSILIGLIFGVYPAMKAARLDPIEALRYE